MPERDLRDKKELGVNKERPKKDFSQKHED